LDADKHALPPHCAGNVAEAAHRLSVQEFPRPLWRLG
jgi:hypothetical protein